MEKSHHQLHSHLQPKELPQKDTHKVQHKTDQITKTSQISRNKSTSTTNKRAIWDCGSTLYDSFELNSFQKQLDSAIISSSRTFSMPRLPSEDIRVAAPPPAAHPQKKPVALSKLSKSFQKLLKSVFRAPRPTSSKSNYDSGSSSPDPWFLDPLAQTEMDKKLGVDGGRYYVAYEKENGLSTIPEVPEVAFSPEAGSLVRKTMSDRFRPASVGTYCA